MAVPQQRVQISQFSRRHPNRWEAVFDLEAQEQQRIAPIELLPCVGSAARIAAG